MIMLTKLNDTPFVLNSDLIETIEENPDTTIKLTSKNIVIVRETMQQVVDKVSEAEGIKGILNFSPVSITVPDHILVYAVDISVELEKLLFYLKHKES